MSIPILEKKHGLLKKNLSKFKVQPIIASIKIFQIGSKSHVLKPILVNDSSRMLFKDTFL